jgi:hypothetical protein
MAAVYSAPNDISIKPQPAQPPKLLDRLRHVLRAKHYSYRIEQAYVAWVRRFILFHGKRHPQEMRRHETMVQQKTPQPLLCDCGVM